MVPHYDPERHKKMKTKIVFMLTVSLVVTALASSVWVGCSDDGDSGASGDSWPIDYGAVFSKIISDPADDLVPAPGGGSPAYPVDYPPADVTQVSLGVQGDYLYIRIDFADVIPTAPVYIPANPPVEDQVVHEHVTNIAMDTDNDDATGCMGIFVDGVDVLFTVTVGYGLRGIRVNTLYDCIPGTDHYQSELPGEYGAGGSGYDTVTVRHNVFNLGNLFPSGVNVEIDVWSEAMSFDSNGIELYHHYAFDMLTPTNWILP